MKLDDWLKSEGVSDRDFAVRIGVRRQALHRYKTGRIPKATVMAAIHQATAGAVTPNDFLPSISDLTPPPSDDIEEAAA